MRTIFVNPSVRRARSKPSKKRGARRNPKATKATSLVAYKKGLKDAMRMKISNPRRRRRRSAVRRHAAPKRRVRRRARRRNAGITPFVANPMILNPKRRSRRRNPGLKLNVKSALRAATNAGIGAGLGLAVNGLVINKYIASPWLQCGARVVAAIGAGLLLGPKYRDIATTAAGALMYPSMQQLAIRFLPAGTLSETAPLPVAREAIEANLDVLSADLDAALSGYGGNSYNPIFS